MLSEMVIITKGVLMQGFIIVSNSCFNNPGYYTTADFDML